MDKISIKEFLSEFQKLPETVEEFVFEISGKKPSNNAIIEIIKLVEEKLKNENLSAKEEVEFTNFLDALKIVLDINKTKK